MGIEPFQAACDQVLLDKARLFCDVGLVLMIFDPEVAFGNSGWRLTDASRAAVINAARTALAERRTA